MDYIAIIARIYILYHLSKLSVLRYACGQALLLFIQNQFGLFKGSPIEPLPAAIAKSLILTFHGNAAPWTYRKSCSPTGKTKTAYMQHRHWLPVCKLLADFHQGRVISCSMIACTDFFCGNRKEIWLLFGLV